MNLSRLSRRTCSFNTILTRQFYVQGQYSPEGKREYFYFVDHHGMLYLDDARIKNFTSCFKEKQFLAFFFGRLKVNYTDKYVDKDFRYLSPCGRELNYVRCEDTPIVFTHLKDENEIIYNHGGNRLSLPFEPEEICMLPSTGRIYHPCPSRGGSVALISDKLSIQWTEENRFTFGLGTENPPTKFRWRGKDVTLTKRLLDILFKRTE